MTGCASMNIGDAFVMLGGWYHAGGHNQTGNEKRPMYDLSFIRGYLR